VDLFCDRPGYGYDLVPNNHYAFHIALNDLNERGPVQGTWYMCVCGVYVWCVFG
jgi:hypothetical protein